MSQKRGKKRPRRAFDNLSKAKDTVKDIHKLAKPPRKRRRTHRTLPRNLQQIMGKATSAYMNEEYATAKSLAQKVAKAQPKYSDVYSLLGKIYESQSDYSNALTAYAAYITLRFKNKSIQSETAKHLFKKDGTERESINSDSDNSDTFDDDSDTNPTPELIEKIASLALKSKDFEMALDMIGKIESHYRVILNRISDTKNWRHRIAVSDEEMKRKKEEIIACLVNIYRRRANIYHRLKKADLERKEYESIYKFIHKNTHPLLVSQNNNNNSSNMEMDSNHKELLYILQKLCHKSHNYTAYRLLFNYFDLFMESNKFEKDNHEYIQWLIDSDNSYKTEFYALLRRFVSVGIEMCRFKAILKYLEYFASQLSQTFPAILSIKKGICLLWLNKIESAMTYYHSLIAMPEQTGLGSLYMLFLDAFIAKNRLKLAKDLMHKIEQISHFNIPRIWLRFADCYTLDRKYERAILKYKQVIQAVSAHSEYHQRHEILLSARLKLLEIYFMSNDDESAKELLEIIDSEMREENSNIITLFKPQKKMRLNAQLTSYFECGLFGFALVPKELWHLVLLTIKLRAQYKECLQLFKSGKYYPYLVKCEGKLIELLALCSERPKFITHRYCVTFESSESCLNAVPLRAYNEQTQSGAMASANHNKITKLSQIIAINGENVRESKFEEITQTLDRITAVPVSVEFISEQNIHPLLPCNRNLCEKKIYSINHLSHVLKDSKILELILYLCKIWYECDANDESVTEYKKLKEIELILQMICEASSALNPQKQELNPFVMAELHLLMANIHFNNGSFEHSYHELVKVLDLAPNNVNAMRYLYTIYRHCLHNPKIERTIKRQLIAKNSNESSLVWHQLILGHTSFSKNSYDIAANTYAKIMQNSNNNSAFMHLMLAVTFLQHAMKRTTKESKYFVVIQGIAFMKRYVKLSHQNNTESLYNFARALHLLGLYGSAQVLYEKIINQIKYIHGGSNTAFNPIQRYCAYNLSKIYLKSGQNDLAIQILKQNVIV